MNTKIIECPECDGFGWFEEDYEPIPGIHAEMGMSVKGRARCKACNGTGEVRQLTDEDDDDIRDTAGFDGFDSHSTYDDWRQP